MKKKFSPIWRVVVALALVGSLGMVFAAPTVANPDGPPPADMGTIIINKVTLPPEAPDTFAFTLDATPVGSIGDGGQIVIPDVPPGMRVVGEVAPPGWMLVDIDCSTSFTRIDSTAEFTVDPCEVVELTFYNFGGHVTVDIIECPEYDVPVSTTFVVKAEITNWMDCLLGPPHWGPPVVAYVEYGGAVTLMSDPDVMLGRLHPGETNTAVWTFHCYAPGPTPIKVKTNFGGLDECVVQQIVEPGLAVEVMAPCEICTNCEAKEPPWNTGTVDARIINTGDVDIVNIHVDITASAGATLTGFTTRTIALLPARQSVLISTVPPGPFTFTCDNDVLVTFTVEAQGVNACELSELVPPSPASGTDDTYQRDLIVEVPCVLGLSTEINPESTWNPPNGTVPGTEKYFPACDEVCKVDASGEAYDVVSTCQNFQYTAMVKNCSGGTMTNLAVTIHLPGGVSINDDEPVHIWCPNVDLEDWIEPASTTVTLDTLCPCCTAYITWILHCDESSYGAPQYITVDVQGMWYNTDCSPAYVIQENKVHLTGLLEAYVSDCTDCCPVKVDAVAVSQDFDVRFCVENTGEADAYDVEGELTVSGDTDCASLVPYYFYIGDIPAGEFRCVWLSDIAGDLCHCNDCGQVEVMVTSLLGYDENTCERIKDDNIEPTCPLLIDQCPITVEIVNPEFCDEICYGDFFGVKAKITNCCVDSCTCDFEDVEITLSWEGPGDVIISEGPNPWELLEVTTWCDECTEYFVGWEVHCVKPGDVTFHVCVESAMGDYAQGQPLKIQIAETQAEPATVHQRPRPEITVEIISPENLDTFVATSQEFSVTAVIANKTMYCDYCGDLVKDFDMGGHFHDQFVHPEVLQFPVTITDFGLCLHPDSGATILDGPTEPFEIEAGETATLTWTLQCDESGLLVMDAYAVAETYGICPPQEAFSFPILVWQYPTAHLEVKDLEVTKDPVTVCETFTVSANIVNTGEADATEVEATLSIIPEDSAHITEGGYTQYVGTLAGHGQDGTKSVSWTVHCKQACDTTFTVTAEGADEYGWHKKQECQSTGNFIVEAGCLYLELVPSLDPYRGDGWVAAVMVGEASGLIGPFNVDTPISWTDFSGFDIDGDLVAMGFVNPDMDFVEYHNHVEQILRMCDCPDLLDFLEMLNLQGVDKDVMVLLGHLRGEFGTPSGSYSTCMCVGGGLIQVINGNIAGTELLFSYDMAGMLSMLGGTYCSTMAQEALRPIPERFIEDASTTVKQVTPAQLVVDVTFPDDGVQFDRSDDFPVTAIITNIGEETADGVHAVLTVDDYATITDDADKDLGDIAGGASVDATWDVHCDDPGFSVFKATATGTGDISTNPVEAFDTVTVEQGEMPAAQLVVDISYPENGDEFIVGDQFVVTARIENLGERTAETVDVSIDPGDNASYVSGPTGGWTQDIGPTSSAVASWMLVCDATGFSVITVTAAGDNTNSAVEPVTIEQVPVPAPYLVVEVSAPVEVVDGDSFFVTAVVSNIGDADATGVDATTEVNGPASPPTETKSIGDIDAGDSATKEFELTCTGEGGVNVAVSAEGTETNTAADSAAVEQVAAPPGDTTAPVVTVNVPNGGETWQGGTQQAITWSATDDVTPQEDLDIVIYYSSNGGTSWTFVDTFSYNDGAYKWLVPAINSSQCLVQVIAIDDAYNEAFDISDGEFTIYTPPEPVYEYAISLDEGWNLISLPLIPDDPAIAVVLAGISGPGSVEVVWAYDAETETWHFYSPGPVGDLAEMKDGLGYWLDMTDSATLTVYGSPMPEPPWTPPAYDVYMGYNLIGFKSLGPMADDIYLYNILGDYTVIWGYDGGYFLVFPSPPGSGELETGLGYWIWITTEGVIIPPGL